MADNYNISTNLGDILKSSGLDANDPGATYVNFERQMAEQAMRQQTQAQQVQEAAERIKQAKLASTQKQEASDVGVNPELKDYLSIEEATALLKANGIKQDHIDEFIKSMGDKQYVSRQAIQAVILKRGGAGSLSLVGAKEGSPMQNEEGKWVRTWIKRTPDLGILMTDRVSPVGVAVFQAEDPTGYEAGHTMLSIQDPKLAATTSMAESKKTLADAKVEQNKIQNWLTLEKRVNPNSTAGQNALGLSGKANQRADRAFGLLAVPNQTWEGIHAIETDLAGILTGGVPQLPTIEDQQIFEPAKERVARALEFFTAHRTEGLVPVEIEKQLFDLIKEIKNVDNEIIDKQLGIVEVSAEDIVNKDRPRWERLKNAILTTTESQEEDKAYAKLYGASSAAPAAAAPGAKKTKSGIHYTVGQ